MRRYVLGIVLAAAVIVAASAAIGRVADGRAEDAAAAVLARFETDAAAGTATLGADPCGSEPMTVPFEGDPVVRRALAQGFDLGAAEVELVTEVPDEVVSANPIDDVDLGVADLFVQTEIRVIARHDGGWCRSDAEAGALLVAPGGVEYIDTVGTLAEITGLRPADGEGEAAYLDRLAGCSCISVDDLEVVDHLRQLAAQR